MAEQELARLMASSCPEPTFELVVVGLKPTVALKHRSEPYLLCFEVDQCSIRCLVQSQEQAEHFSRVFATREHTMAQTIALAGKRPGSAVASAIDQLQLA